MSDKDRLVEHEYDGIQEYDNPMPRWWVTIFWATIIYSILYALNIGGMGSGKGRVAEYEADMAAWRDAHPQGPGPADAAAILALTEDPTARADGEALYQRYCAACHVADGGGLIGPNLTDDYWLHGGTIDSVHAVIVEGVLAKGMPPWAKTLTAAQVNQVTAYVWTLRGTTPKQAKAPQGVLIPR